MRRKEIRSDAITRIVCLMLRYGISLKEIKQRIQAIKVEDK